MYLCDECSVSFKMEAFSFLAGLERGFVEFLEYFHSEIDNQAIGDGENEKGVRDICYQN